MDQVTVVSRIVVVKCKCFSSPLPSTTPHPARTHAATCAVSRPETTAPRSPAMQSIAALGIPPGAPMFATHAGFRERCVVHTRAQVDGPRGCLMRSIQTAVQRNMESVGRLQQTTDAQQNDQQTRTHVCTLPTWYRVCNNAHHHPSTCPSCSISFTHIILPPCVAFYIRRIQHRARTCPFARLREDGRRERERERAKCGEKGGEK